MGSNTVRFGLYKPAGSDFINETTDLNNNWDTIDANCNPTLQDSKTADTSRASTTTLTADPDISLSLVAGKDYLLEGVLFLGPGAEAGDFKYAFHMSTGSANGSYGSIGLAVGVTDVQGNVKCAALSDVAITNAVSANVGIDDVGATILLVTGLIRCVTAGALQLHWAQNASNATPTVLKKDSYIKLERTN